MKLAIVILGGGLIKDKHGKWSTTTFDERGGRFGVQGDRLRIIAAAILAKKYTHARIIASGGKGQLKQLNQAPTLARVIKRELVTLGVPRRRIISESRSGTTFGQFWLLAPLLKALRIQTVLLISNRYHLPRIRAMLQYHRRLRARWQGIKYKLVAAEEILVEEDPRKWKREITQAYRSRAMHERMARERKGIVMIQSGAYRYRIT